MANHGIDEEFLLGNEIQRFLSSQANDGGVRPELMFRQEDPGAIHGDFFLAVHLQTVNRVQTGMANDLDDSVEQIVSAKAQFHSFPILNGPKLA